MNAPTILHAGDGFVVLDKPTGVSLFADRTGADAFWPAVQAAFDNPLQVHRIDKGTSGCLLVALDPELQAWFTRAFSEQRIGKWYLAVVQGTPGGRHINLPLAPGRKSRFRVAGPRDAITRSGNTWHLADGAEQGNSHPSATSFRVLRSGRNRSLLAIRPHSGRTHQIRVHLSWLGHPLLGEHLYGTPKLPAQQFPRLALHAHKLVLPMPGGTAVTVRAPVPAQFLRAVSSARAAG